MRRNPHLYEINTSVWLRALGRRRGEKITLSKVPREEWTALKDQGMDLIWLMGVWKRSPGSKRVAQSLEPMVREARVVLDDFQMEDIGGSPYAVYRYSPDPAIGSSRELLNLRTTLEREGLSLILDFVPNHTALDHPWVRERPDYFVQRPPSPRGACSEGFFRIGRSVSNRRCIAHGRDPYFPPWTDTAQLNYFNEATIESMAQTLRGTAPFCHGFRCDMAMLILRRIFKDTWASELKEMPEGKEFWPLAVENLRSRGYSPLFLGEAYWGTEKELLSCGFDYAYDKSFYDLLTRGDVQGLKRHLSSPLSFQEKMARFIENHDEPRISALLGEERIRSAMVLHGTLPGLRLWHQGQFEGCRIKIPVQLRRGPEEPRQEELLSFSRSLLQEVNHPVFHEGSWELLHTSGWPDNQSHEGLLAWSWRLGEERRLIVVNFNPHPSQGCVRLPPDWVEPGGHYLLRDPLKGETYQGSMENLKASGLYVGLGVWDYHFFIWEKG